MEDLGTEGAVHGSPWGLLHGGYFSSPEVARPMADAVRRIWEGSRPEVIVDLGGGTGFLLSRLREECIGLQTALIDLDGSGAQLGVAQNAGISSVCGSVESFQRETVVPAGCRALWMMRSVLHYAGEAGLAPMLRHLREQAAEGEYWVHQTACFEREEDARCLNALYRRMHTTKWYPAVAELQRQLESAGWRVLETLPAPVLHLDSGELGFRYGLNDAELARVGKEMAEAFGGREEVFRLRPGGFQADLRYRIWACVAAS